MTPAEAKAKQRSAMLWLKLVGFSVVVFAVLLLGISLFRPVQFSQPAETLMLIGVGAVIIAELLPAIESLKFGPSGIELALEPLSESTTDQILELKNRVARLELQADTKAVAGKKPSAWKQAPEKLTKAGDYYNDPRKGQFGGSATSKGLKLEASFGRSTKEWADVRLRVVAETQGEDVSDVTAVQFFLHNSFKPDRIKAPMVDGEAKLSLTSWGGFTVGVWVPQRDATLELDLAQLPDAPAVIRDR